MIRFVISTGSAVGRVPLAGEVQEIAWVALSDARNIAKMPSPHDKLKEIEPLQRRLASN